MVATREAAHDAAFLRLEQAKRKLHVAEASGWSDYLVNAARRDVVEASDVFTLAQAELKAARTRDEREP